MQVSRAGGSRAGEEMVEWQVGETTVGMSGGCANRQTCRHADEQADLCTGWQSCRRASERLDWNSKRQAMSDGRADSRTDGQAGLEADWHADMDDRADRRTGGQAGLEADWHADMDDRVDRRTDGQAGLEADWHADMDDRADRRTGEQAGLEADWHADLHTGGRIVDQASWLVGNHTDRPIKTAGRRASVAADKQARAGGQVDWTVDTRADG